MGEGATQRERERERSRANCRNTDTLERCANKCQLMGDFLKALKGIFHPKMKILSKIIYSLSSSSKPV